MKKNSVQRENKTDVRGERESHLGRTLAAIGVSLAALLGVGVAAQYWIVGDAEEGGASDQASVATRSTASGSESVRETSDIASRTPVEVPATSFEVEPILQHVASAKGGEAPPSGETVTDTQPVEFANVEVADGAVAIAELAPTDRGLNVVPVDYDAAERLFHDGQYSEAALYFGVYADVHSGNPWGHYMEALSLWKSGDPVSSELAFLRALDCDEDHLKSLINLTRVRLELGEYESARLPIDRALALSPQSVQAHRVSGRLEHNLGNATAAEDSYLQALRIDAEDVWSLNNLGLLRIEAGRFEEALTPLARACELDNDNVRAQNNLGTALERSGDLSGADEAFVRVLALQPNHARAGISHERVSARVETQSRPSIDLAALATRFLDELAAADSMVAEEEGLEAEVVRAESSPPTGSIDALETTRATEVSRVIDIR